MKLTTFSNYTTVTLTEESLTGIISKIKQDTGLAALTDAYRTTGHRSLKEASPCFTPTCRFSNEGIRELAGHNPRYEPPNLEQDLLLLYFRRLSDHAEKVNETDGTDRTDVL